MPSSRFLKLPDEKRSKILRAVHSELAEFPVDELSINRIIHGAWKTVRLYDGWRKRLLPVQ